MFQIEVVQKFKTHFLLSAPFFFFAENRTVFETRTQTRTQKYVILIALSQQQWFCERA
jgi:hypothetical protein